MCFVMFLSFCSSVSFVSTFTEDCFFGIYFDGSKEDFSHGVVYNVVAFNFCCKTCVDNLYLLDNNRF